MVLWCKVVTLGASCFSLVQVGAPRCKVVQVGAIWYKLA